MNWQTNRIVAMATFCISISCNATGLDSLSLQDANASVRQALSKGADYAISNLGQPNGFLGNPKVRIPLPASLQKVEKGLQMLGMGKQAEQLTETMNHAAEQAVAGARPVLADAIRKMTLKDAKDILSGGDDSVTQYFRRTTSDSLNARFLPIVRAATQKVQLGEQYNRVAGSAARLGLIDQNDADIDSYVSHKAMDGLFSMIAEQEKALRSNPLQAGNALLSRVFGMLAQ